jgi:hypothetical protein
VNYRCGTIRHAVMLARKLVETQGFALHLRRFIISWERDLSKRAAAFVASTVSRET